MVEAKPVEVKAAAPVVPKPAAVAPAATVTGAGRQEQKRADAQERQRRANQAKPLETRIKRLEEQMAKLNAKKAAVDARLAGSEIYEEGKKEELKSMMLDQAYLAKELAQIEAEWLEKQAELEAMSTA